jgi:transposase InsO family protein
VDRNKPSAAFPDEIAPTWLHRDRNGVYGEGFRRRVAGIGIAEVVSAAASPWQNPYAERVIGSIRRECLDHVIVLNQAYLPRVLAIHSRYYPRSRAHLGLEKDAPRSPSRFGYVDGTDHGDSRGRRGFVTVTNGRPRRRQTCLRA